MENETTGSLVLDVDGNVVDVSTIESDFIIKNGTVITGSIE